jgi:outer membrane lipoprotein-sorting protein
MHPITKALAGATLALFCTAAAATPKDDLHAAFTRFMKIRSFRATVTDPGKGEQISTMEYVAPNRYRMKTADGPQQIIVGDAMYMDMDGKLMRMPIPGVGKLTARYRNEVFLHEMEGGMTVTALPNEVVDGEPAKVYAYTMTQPVKSDAKTWISVKTGLPIQVESTGSFMGHTSTARIHYSNFNDPSIRIDAPT